MEKELVLPKKIAECIENAKNKSLKAGLERYHKKRLLEKEIEREKKRKIREKINLKKKEKEKNKKKRQKIKKKKEKEKLIEKIKEKEKKKKEREKLKNKNKRPVGRPKKRGPKVKYWKRRKKKNLKKRGRKKLPDFNYRIISCKNGSQNKIIGKYRTLEKAYEDFNKLKENEKNIIFPIRFCGNDVLKKSIDEYILVCKSGSNKSNFFRNEYGVIIENKTNIDGCEIIDKMRYHKEEKFWVWGYDNKSDRKTFLWIYENLVKSEVSILEVKRIYTYKNKLIIKEDDNINIVFCKTQNDAVLFYNMLQALIKKEKIKYVVFIGDFTNKSELKKKIEDEIIKLTGFTRARVQMSGNSYFMTKIKEKKEN